MPVKNDGGAGALVPPAGLSYVVCGEPLLKAEFLDGLAGRGGDTVYIDLDMMYGGFLRAGMAAAPRRPGGLLHIRAAGEAEARGALGQAISAVSAGGAATVVIDTLNGLHEAGGGASGSERRAEAAIMLLAMAARHTSSRIVVACIAERRGREWHLLPGRRRLPVAAGGDGATWLRLVRGDRPGEGRDGEAIALEPLGPGGAPSRRGPGGAPSRRGPDAPGSAGPR